MSLIFPCDRARLARTGMLRTVTTALFLTNTQPKDCSSSCAWARRPNLHTTTAANPMKRTMMMAVSVQLRRAVFVVDKWCETSNARGDEEAEGK
jgi:hypothetical protein